MPAIIAARGRDNVIGINNTLPWHLPADLKKFKSITNGCPIIMGRKTHDAIGRPLPGRLNIVISRGQQQQQGCETVTSLAAALQLAKKQQPREIFIIGGGEIYREAVNLVERLYITEVNVDTPGGDTFFPSVDAQTWRQLSHEAHAATADTPAYAFVVYERR